MNVKRHFAPTARAGSARSRGPGPDAIVIPTAPSKAGVEILALPGEVVEPAGGQPCGGGGAHGQ